MAEETTNVAAPAEAPKKPEPMTEERFLNEGYALMEEGKKAGLPVYGLLVRLGVREGSGLIEQGLAFLQNSRAPIGKK